MTLKHLAIQAKKSLSGLYPMDQTYLSSPEEKSNRPTMSENVSPTSVTFGSCPASPSPSKDSPSKRKRLLGSLRSMGSLRSLRQHHGNKQLEEPAVQGEAISTPKHGSPSLELNFEMSSTDQPLFDPNQSHSSNSSLYVHHSSPITVPFATFHAGPTGSPSVPSNFPLGTVPDSPTPLQKAFDKEVANFVPSLALTSFPMEDVSGCDPNPTPMPGTHLSLEYNTPGITVSISSTEPGHKSSGYFDIPTKDDHVMSADATTNAGNSLSDETGLPKTFDSTAVTIIDVAEGSRPPPGKLEPMRSKENSMTDLHKDPLILDTLPLKSGASDGVTAHLAYIIWDDCLNYENSVSSAQSPGENHLERRRSTWSRHTGLYDGTGYGDYTSSAPQEPCPPVGNDAYIPKSFRPKSEFINDIKVLKEFKPASIHQHESDSVTDEKEALDEVIRAYAFPMLYHDEAKDEQDFDYESTLSEEEVAAGVTVKTKAEVALSIRVMNRSLGG